MLLRGCPEAATSEERRVHQQLKALLEAATAQQAESAGGQEHHPPTAQICLLPSIESAGREAEATTSAVRSRLGPNSDAQNTIEARQRAKSVDNHRDNRSRRHDDRGRGRRHDSDDDHDRSWSPN
jgi:hypothetical protein